MAAGTTPIFVDTPKTWAATASVANTNRDGTGTIVDLVGTSTDGALVEFIDVKAQGTLSGALLVNLFLHNGTSWFFWKALALTDTTAVSATVDSQGRSVDESDLPLPLPPTWKLGFAPTTSQTINAIARGGEY